MIAKFLKIAAKADELVAHNGDWFDLKWFQARCLKHGLQPLPDVKTVDTLGISRRRFQLNSHTLDYLAWYLFGEKKIKTDFKMWRDIAMHNDPKQLAKMTKYCRRDVALLERVYHEIARFEPAKSHAGVAAGLAKWTCQHCGSENIKRDKGRTTTKGTVQHTMQCKECKRYYTISNAAYWSWYEYDHNQRRLDAEVKTAKEARAKAKAKAARVAKAKKKKK